MGGGATAWTAAKAAAFGGYRAIRSPWARGFSSPTTEFYHDEEEEWDGGEEERVCIPAPPTTEEADGAVALLKDTLREHLRLPPIPWSSSGVRNSVVTQPRSASSMSSGCAVVIGSTVGRIVRVFPSRPAATAHVARAFSLLRDCPEAQSIVTSLAVDINVWNAVMKNKKVLDFLNAHTIDVPAKAGESREEPEDGDRDTALPIPGDGLKELICSVKQKVKSLVSTISDLFESFIGSNAAGGEAAAAIQAVNGGGGGSGGSFEEKAVAATSLVALVIATIIVILLKREEI